MFAPFFALAMAAFYVLDQVLHLNFFLTLSVGMTLGFIASRLDNNRHRR